MSKNKESASVGNQINLWSLGVRVAKAGENITEYVVQRQINKIYTKLILLENQNWNLNKKTNKKMACTW